MKTTHLVLLAAAVAALAVPVLSARSLAEADLDIDFFVCGGAVLDQCCGKFDDKDKFAKCELTIKTNKTVEIREKEFKKHLFDLSDFANLEKKKKELPPREEVTVTTIEKEEWVRVKNKNDTETWKFVGAAVFCVCPVS